MDSFSNGGLSGEVSNKRPLENGCVPKFKPRKVSAVRDFPPGCGPNAMPESLRPEEICGSGAGSTDAIGIVNLGMPKAVGVNGDGTSVMADLMGSEAVGNSEVAKFSETKDSEIQDVVECQSSEEDRPQTSLSFQHWAHLPVSETLDTLMEKAKENVTFSKKLVTEIGPLGTHFPDESETETHVREAVNNPIEMERDGQLGAYVGKVSTTVIDGLLDEVQDQEVMPEPDLVGVDILKDMKTLEHSGAQTMLEDVKEDNSFTSCHNLLDNHLVLSASCGNIQPETSIRPKDKYRPRRVSAVRDFPPYCGINVSLPIEEGKEMATPGKDSPNRTEEVESEPCKLANVSEREITGEMLTTSGDLDGLHNVHLEMEKSETFNDGAGRGFLGEITVATKRTEASPVSGTLVNTSTMNARGPIGIEIDVFSPDRNGKDSPPESSFRFGNNSNREIVHGLMAAPYCPWRKSKAAINSREGGTYGQKTRRQNVPLRQKPKADALNSNLEEAKSLVYPSLKKSSSDSHDVDETPGKLTLIDEGYHGTCIECVPEVTPISMFNTKVDNSDNDYTEPIRKDVVVYSPGDSDEGRNSHDAFDSKDNVDREVVQALMAAPHCPWRKEKAISNINGGISGGKKRKLKSWRHKGKAVAKKSNPEIHYSGQSSKKKNKVHKSNDVDEEFDALMLADDGDHDQDEGVITNSPASRKLQDFEINFPRIGRRSSGPVDPRDKVRDTLRLFNFVYRKFVQLDEAKQVRGEEGKSKLLGKKVKRIDLYTMNVLKEQKKLVNTTKMVGAVPGVEVGDEFQYRVELAVVGIHFPFQSGIDSVKVNDVPLATSIVTSGAYFDDVENADVLRYSGQGGNVIGKSKKPEDQKMERGNLALKNSIDAKTPVRVVRGWKEMKIVDPLETKPKLVTTYIYDGLYTVTKCSTEKGPHGKMVFMFELKRNPGQPELAWKELKKSSKSKIRPGVCVTDISGGKERLPICAVNTLDDDKPPPFNYIPKMMYPRWYTPTPPEGCKCTGKCSDSEKCLCAVRNGGEIPYTHSGALVETKTLVYECGPHCKCPPSCYNRATQRGIKFQLEVFKTEWRGWGVRALSSIPSGSFICEYIGEFLEEKEADERIGNDEYLFDIGQNLIDSSANPEEQKASVALCVEKGYTIDALAYGNVGRFINHSCSPNLFAQNVIYDNDDKRTPHIMLVALENIPPLKELTYHYNYKLDQVYDSEGNIKVKNCYCGAADCSGRMY